MFFTPFIPYHFFITIPYDRTNMFRHNLLLKLINPFKRKRMKITDSNRHISKGKHKFGVAVQAHDATFFSLEDATRDTDFLLLLDVVLQRTLHQFDIVGHGFIQIDKFFHLPVGDHCCTIRLVISCKILPGSHID